MESMLYLVILGVVFYQSAVPCAGLPTPGAVNVSVTPTVGSNVTSKGKVFCDTGMQQSPIDIVTSSCKTKEYPHMTFVDDTLFKNEVQYENNCETVKITLKDKTLKPKVKGGPLPDGSTYIVDNVHFHWGLKNSEGCEHTISGKHFPMEAHMVLYKDTFKTFNDALQDKGVGVVSFLFELDKQTDKNLLEMIHGVTEILQPHSTFICSGTSLTILKDYISGGFYSYEGSLTTHECSEGILWTVIKNPIPIGKTQLLIFHDVIGDDAEELQNWRAVKPLNNREVYQSSY